MNIEKIQKHCLSKKCVTEEFPFDADTYRAKGRSIDDKFK